MFNDVSDSSWSGAIGKDDDKNKRIWIGSFLNALENFYETLKKELEKGNGDI